MMSASDQTHGISEIHRPVRNAKHLWALSKRRERRQDAHSALAEWQLERTEESVPHHQKKNKNKNKNKVRTLKFGPSVSIQLWGPPVRATVNALIDTDMDGNGIDLWHSRVRQVSRVLAPQLRSRMVGTLLRDIIYNLYIHRLPDPPYFSIDSLPSCTYDMIELCYCLSDPFEDDDGWFCALRPMMTLVQGPEPDGVDTRFMRRTVLLLAGDVHFIQSGESTTLDVFGVPV